MSIRTIAEVFAPGEFVDEELKVRGWSQIELAEIMGRPARLISELISAKRAITPETAKGLGAAFGTGPELWMNLERDYQLSRSLHDDSAVERRAKLYAKAPVKEMIKRHWIEPSENIDVLWQRVLGFLHISDIDEEPSLAHAAKKGASYAEVSPAQWAWLFRAKELAEQISVPKFSRKKLTDELSKLECLLIAAEEVRHVPRILSECGVRYVVVEKLPQARIDGVCLWLDDESPVIGMSLSRDTIDNYWFVLRHEIEHILQGHGKDYPMIDAELSGIQAGTDDSLPKDERVANAAAADFCVPSARLQSFIARKHPFYYERDVVGFARLVNRHPGLIVGQMQFRLNNYSYLAKHLAKIRHLVTPGAITDGWGQEAHISTR
jgi:HTH-type transcriptional regulator/antitoxin HigA